MRTHKKWRNIRKKMIKNQNTAKKKEGEGWRGWDFCTVGKVKSREEIGKGEKIVKSQRDSFLADKIT